jgi:hypothetical protein
MIEYFDLVLRAVAVASTGTTMIRSAIDNKMMSEATAHVVAGLVIVAGFVITNLANQGSQVRSIVYLLLGKWGEMFVRIEVLLVTSIALALWCGAANGQVQRVTTVLTTAVVTSIVALVITHLRARCDL